MEAEQIERSEPRNSVVEIHFSGESHCEAGHRLCDFMGEEVQYLSEVMDDVTCKNCRKRGAWLYGW